MRHPPARVNHFPDLLWRALMARWLVVIVGSALAAGCMCGGQVQRIEPELAVAPTGIDFGQVKVGGEGTRALTLEAKTNAVVQITRIAVEGQDAAAFTAGAVNQVDPLGTAMLPLTFRPTRTDVAVASLVIETNSPTTPKLTVPLVGEGAVPTLGVDLECRSQAPDNCVGTVTASPRAIDFGAEPLRRASPLPVTRLPAVFVRNAGSVDVTVRAVRLGGADPTAFTVEGLPVLPTGGQVLGTGEGFNVRVRFVPTSMTKTSYAATLTVESDDAAAPTITIALRGTLLPNASPQVCANVVRVVPATAGEAPREYGGAAFWNTTPGPEVDLTISRDIRPGDTVLLSASLDAMNPATCSNDPEDGRSLTYAWTVVSGPQGVPLPALTGAASASARLTPVAVGTYVVELTVRDSAMASATVRLRFSARIKKDLVVQLEWPGYANVDLDLHLVRPSAVADAMDPFSGAFAFFGAGAAGRTSGDLNGYAASIARADPGRFDFDWGDAGTDDNPVLDVDEKGMGGLVESVSLNYPERDTLCATQPCRYRVYAHYFKDLRPIPTASCFVDGGAACVDGDVCSCAGTHRCVAANADAGTGPGTCFDQPSPQLRFFFFGSATASAVVPLEGLMPPNRVTLGAPCAMLYLADIVWPARPTIGSLPDGGSPPPQVLAQGTDGGMRIERPIVRAYGRRALGQDLQCVSNDDRGGTAWYAPQ